VRCEIFREALSARIDGEPEPLEPAEVDRHLESCAECRAWYSRAQDLRRFMTVRAAPVVPDLTGVVLERIPAPTGERWGARVGLAIVAIAQLSLSVAQLLGMGNGMTISAMAGHLSHESTAWNAAVGVGLLWAALRPKAAAGQLPVVTGFVLVLLGLSVVDLMGNAVTGARLASHVFVLLGLVLLFVVRHQYNKRHGAPGNGDAVTPGAEIGGTEGFAGPAAVPDEARSGPNWRRPASRHNAA
jgi:predicted anti-sigma-YlaC factor YlaD